MSKLTEFKAKDKYKILNWKEYNESLKNRGKITLWISKEAINSWAYTGTRERGGKIGYSDLAIKTCLTIKQVIHLKLRQTEGFVNSLFEIMSLEINAPDYSTLSRRAGKLQIELKAIKQKGNIDIQPGERAGAAQRDSDSCGFGAAFGVPQSGAEFAVRGGASPSGCLRFAGACVNSFGDGCLVPDYKE